MNITIYGLLGHAHKLKLPIESLDMEDCMPGEEFPFNGRVYEIRSVSPTHDGVSINVSLVMNHAIG